MRGRLLLLEPCPSSESCFSPLLSAGLVAEGRSAALNGPFSWNLRSGAPCSSRVRATGSSKACSHAVSSGASEVIYILVYSSLWVLCHLRYGPWYFNWPMQLLNHNLMLF